MSQDLTVEFLQPAPDMIYRRLHQMVDRGKQIIMGICSEVEKDKVYEGVITNDDGITLETGHWTFSNHGVQFTCCVIRDPTIKARFKSTGIFYDPTGVERGIEFILKGPKSLPCLDDFTLRHDGAYKFQMGYELCLPVDSRTLPPVPAELIADGK